MIFFFDAIDAPSAFLLSLLLSLGRFFTTTGEQLPTMTTTTTRTTTTTTHLVDPQHAGPKMNETREGERGEKKNSRNRNPGSEFFSSSLALLPLECSDSHSSTSINLEKKNRTAMADVLARLEDGSLAAVDGGLLAEKVESAVSLLDRTMDLYG